MCHTTHYHHHGPQDRLLHLKSITLHLSLSTTTSLLPDSLTFVFLPRINGAPLQINGSSFHPDSPAFLSLHRRTLHSSSVADIVFTSDDRVSASDGSVFEVHVGENRLIHGVFRRCDDGGLKMECKCVAESEFGVKEAVVVTAAENGGFIREKVKVTAVKRRRFCRKFEVALAEIPEERVCDVEEDDDVEGSGVACCCCGEDDEGKSNDFDKMMEMEMEGVRWAVDVGIWAVCIGVGFLVSRASVRSVRRRKKFLV